MVVPKVNPGIWKELDKGHRTKDVHLIFYKAPKNYWVEGLSFAVVMAKDKLLNSQSQPERGTDDAHSEVNTLLSTAIAVLGNAFLDMSQRRREIMRPGINRRYQSLCNQTGGANYSPTFWR